MKRNPLPPRTAGFDKAVTVHGATFRGVYQVVRPGDVVSKWLPAVAAMMFGLAPNGRAEEAAERSVTAPEHKPIPAAKTDCALSGRAVKSIVEAKPEVVIAIVDAQVTAHPTCACEIVKAAIIGSEASSQQVARIVETAIMAAPEQLRMITQCALAVAPDALPHIQMVLAKIDPAAGKVDYTSASAKDSKDAKEVVDAVANPLDFIGPDLPPNEFPPRIPPGTPPEEFPGTDPNPPGVAR